MKNVISALLWIPAALVKLILFVVGLVLVPFTSPYHPIWGNEEHPYAPQWFKPDWPFKLRQYWWRAIRNPVNNIRFLFEDIRLGDLEEQKGVPSPDKAVRELGRDSAWRWRRYKYFSEYMYMRRTGYKKYFEFRIGWKIASPVPGLGFTIQLRNGS